MWSHSIGFLCWSPVFSIYQSINKSIKHLKGHSKLCFNSSVAIFFAKASISSKPVYTDDLILVEGPRPNSAQSAPGEEATKSLHTHSSPSWHFRHSQQCRQYVYNCRSMHDMQKREPEKKRRQEQKPLLTRFAQTPRLPLDKGRQAHCKQRPLLWP